MGGTFDAVGAAGHHCPFGVGEVGRQLRGHMLAVGGCGPRAGDRHEIIEWSGEERCRATSPQDVRTPVAKIVERGRPFFVAGNQRADTGALSCDKVLLKCPSI